MKKLLEKLKGGMVLGIGFLLTIIIGGFIYANLGNIWTPPDELEVNSGDTLTKDLWNATQSNVKDLGQRTLTLEQGLEKIISYSTGEVMTNAVWIDGKPIYKQTFTETPPSAVNSGKRAILIPSGVADVVKSETLYITDDGTKSTSNILYTAEGVLRYTSHVYVAPGDTVKADIFLPSTSVNGYLTATIYFTVYYTKTTD